MITEQTIRGSDYIIDEDITTVDIAAVSGDSATPIKKEEGTRFSGADWADQKKQLLVVGVGGIGSWLTLNLARIGHTIHIIDSDTVDETNVSGGQMYTKSNIGTSKVNSVVTTCRDFGANNPFYPLRSSFTSSSGCTEIVLTGLDNMKARKDVYESWKKVVSRSKNPKDCLLIDGRLLMETCEIITVKGDDKAAMERYEKDFLFDDSEVPDLDCTTKQTTFGAMIIAGLMTATLCNFLTNRKIDEDFREVPFHQRLHLPILDFKIS